MRTTDRPSVALLHRPKRMRRHTAPGAPPGTLASPPGAEAPTVRVISYGESRMLERTLDTPEELAPMLDEFPVTWIDVDGLGDVGVITKLAAVLHLHPLALEDVLSSHQRSKVEQYENYRYIVIRMASMKDGALVTEQLNLFHGANFVATFQEQPGGDCFGPIRQRIRQGGSRVRSAGADYLMYALIDAVIDNYFPLIEKNGDLLEELEIEVIEAPAKTTPAKILGARHDLMQFRRAIWPLREALNTLLHDETKLIAAETRVYLRDCYDHVIQLIDMVETYREVAGGLMDVYLSSVSNRMNEVMKVLTVIATIFIPLSFVASLYGMNFDAGVSSWNMPELRWRYGYPFALGLMAAIMLGLLGYFWKKGWLGDGAPRDR
ncbi:MAG: magnesium/cobalt transporter CorA [Sorangiineae bacterium]|nr:magnesium/cobalt transporter CorA [Polyangiaceae bacterium]MEB2322733.1 magnesium/cobalt transporter CorA [Sorangiineae bacterium]